MVKMYIYTLVYNELCLFCISRFTFIFQCVPVWIGELNETSLLLLVHNTRFIMYLELCVIKYTFVILVPPQTHHEWVGIKHGEQRQNLTWWRHQMETFSALLAICAGNSPVTGEFPAQRPVTRGFDVFFDLRLNQRLSKQSWGWWFETLPRSLWRHCIAIRLKVTYNL